MKHRPVLSIIIATLPMILLGVSVLYRHWGNLNDFGSQLEGSRQLLSSLYECESKLKSNSFLKSNSKVNLDSCNELISLLSKNATYLEQLELLQLDSVIKKFSLQNSSSQVVLSDTNQRQQLKQIIDYALPTTLLELQKQHGNLLNINQLFYRILAIQIFIATLMSTVLAIYLSRKILHEQRLAELGILSAEIAHRLNQPLSSIRLFLQQTRRSLVKVGASDEDKAAIESCLEEVGRASAAVKSILAYARAPDIKHFKNLNLKALVDNVLTAHKEAAEKSNIKLINNIPENLCCLGSEQEIVQLFYILTQNTLDACDGVRSYNCEISASQTAKSVDIQVLDNIGGVDSQLLPRIFEPFVTNKPSGKGTGLGLSIAKKIVEEHRGHIAVESKPGVCTTFTIIFPTHKDASKIEEELVNV